MRLLVLFFLGRNGGLCVHRGADVTAGLLLDGRGNYGRMRNAGLVEAVRRWGDHVRGETAGHQAGHGWIHC